MKHFLTIGTFALLALTMATSCEKQYVTKEYITEEYYNVEGAKVYSYEYTIRPNEWQTGDNGTGRNYLYVECPNTDITENVMNNGAVLAYVWLIYNNNTGDASWNLMPYVYPYSYTNAESNTAWVGENIRYEYENERITFLIEDLDGVLPDEMTDDMIFKVVIVENPVK